MPGAASIWKMRKAAKDKGELVAEKKTKSKKSKAAMLKQIKKRILNNKQVRKFLNLNIQLILEKVRR